MSKSKNILTAKAKDFPIGKVVLVVVSGVLIWSWLFDSAMKQAINESTAGPM